MKSKPVQRDRADPGRKAVSYHSRPLRRRAIRSGEEPGGERDAQEDQDGARDLPDAHLEALGVQPEPAGEDGEVEVAEEGVRGDLEDGVEDDEDGRAVAVAPREVVPDQHHRDAAGETHDDHAGAVLGLVREEEPSETEHQQRADHPREEQRVEEEPVGHAVGPSGPSSS